MTIAGCAWRHYSGSINTGYSGTHATGKSCDCRWRYLFPDARPTNMPRSPVTALMDPTIVGDQMVSSLLDDDLAASLVFFFLEEEEEEEEEG